MQEVKADSFFNFFSPPDVPEVRGLIVVGVDWIWGVDG
jgi:hypothetical protein